MKSEKGLTLISTIVLVIFIALFTFGVVYLSRMAIEKEKEEDIKTDMLLVQAKVKKISGDYLLEKKEDILVGTKLSDLKEQEHIKEFLDKNLFDLNEKGKKYYVLNQQNLNDLELEKVILEQDAYYIVEYTASDVYYTKGYVDESGQMHYKAKEEVKNNSEESSKKE